MNNYSKIENPTHCRKTQKCRAFVFCQMHENAVKQAVYTWEKEISYK